MGDNTDELRDIENKYIFWEHCTKNTGIDQVAHVYLNISKLKMYLKKQFQHELIIRASRQPFLT